MFYLYAYLIVMILVSFRLGYYLYSSLDRYDWQYDKTEYLGAFFFFTILWPLFLFKSKSFVAPSDLFSIEYSAANTQRERDQLWNNPPLCGAIIRFGNEIGRSQGTCGSFEFDAADVEIALRNRLQESPHLMNDDGALLKWVLARDETFKGAADVPSILTDFECIADGLICAGKVKRVNCSACEQDFDLNKLVCTEDQGLPGWNVNRVFCPKGHRLLAVETTHLFMK